MRGHAPSVKVVSPVPDIICSLNTDEEFIRENIKQNVKLGVQQVEPHETQDKVVALVLGGPSLKDTLEDLKEKKRNGMPVITVNGSYEYCIRNGVTPSAMVMLDAREFNNRFVDLKIDTCKYFISSQCHPSVFGKLKNNYVWIWHVAGDENTDLLDEAYDGKYFPIMGGSTVSLRAIHLFRLLGFKRFEIYGWDSCIFGDHHAYTQQENDGEEEIDVIVAGKQFRCTAAHYHQAKEFVDMIAKTGQSYEMIVHGDGLISHIIKNPDSLRKKEEVN